MKLGESGNYSQVPSIVLANKDVLFGNIKEIYQFHSKLVMIITIFLIISKNWNDFVNKNTLY